MKLSESQAGTIELAGTLDMVSVATVRKQLRPFLKGTALTLDLAGVSHADSAVLALLLALRRQQGQQPITLLNVPSSLHGLAELYELGPLLGLTPEMPS